jgi:glutathione synthase/RimK-type ligase-like ATP-grasp enzyme
MQVHLHTDTQTAGHQGMAEHLDTIVKEALGRFGEHVTRVEAHLADAGSHAKALPDEIQCTLEARVVGLEPVVVKDHAATAHQAMHGAVVKLKRTIASALDKHDSKRSAPAIDIAP